MQFVICLVCCTFLVYSFVTGSRRDDDGLVIQKSSDWDITKALTKLLRHKAVCYNVDIRSDGYCDFGEVMHCLNTRCNLYCTKDDVERIATSDSHRFQIDSIQGTVMIRATGKHSLWQVYECRQWSDNAQIIHKSSDWYISKALTKLLRHEAGPNTVRIRSDGYCDFREVMHYLNTRCNLYCTNSDVQRIVSTSDKYRFQMEDFEGVVMIRATQGHSLGKSTTTTCLNHCVLIL